MKLIEQIPLSSEGKAYWSYMDHTITEAMLEKIIAEFLQILNLCPTRLRKLKSYRVGDVFITALGQFKKRADEGL